MPCFISYQPVRNIFLFIRRYANFLLFVLLQVLSIYLIVHYSRYHDAMFSSTANRITGGINKQYNKVDDYLKLRQTNDSLFKANEVLYNRLRENYSLPQNATKTIVDTLRIDSLTQYKTTEYIGAKVVASSVTAQNNYLVLFGENISGLRKDMVVTDPANSLAGVITNISGNYAVVMSLLHRDSKISARLKQSQEPATIIWDGNTPNVLQLHGISKATKVMVGDSVITTGFSTAIPKGILIGRVKTVAKATASSTLNITVTPATNFTDLQYGYIINDTQQEKIKSLLQGAQQQQQ